MFSSRKNSAHENSGNRRPFFSPHITKWWSQSTTVQYFQLQNATEGKNTQALGFKKFQINYWKTDPSMTFKHVGNHSMIAKSWEIV